MRCNDHETALEEGWLLVELLRDCRVVPILRLLHFFAQFEVKPPDE